jgi:CelD/BcsL family acetyltransferase involved in cellulose biosynthesis
MRVAHFSSIDELAPHRRQWDRLSGGVPFRSWLWMTTWWQHYGAATAGCSQLLLLAVFDDAGEVAGIAPWHVEHSRAWGAVVQFLGSGEVCSDYLSILCQEERIEPVVEALADWLGRRSGSRADAGFPPRWDLLKLTGVAAHDPAAARLASRLAERGSAVHRRNSLSCWRLQLPQSWEAYEALLSKGHRKQIRRFQKNLFDTGRAVLHTVGRPQELPRAMEILIDLHQRRRQLRGEPGCFASESFTVFLRDLAGPMLQSGRLELHWLELDGRPAAAEFHLLGDNVVYAYQAGVDPAAMEHQPGSLITMAALRRAIERGYRAFDFLRGDEPYKAHWRAEPLASVELRIAAERPIARLRHGLWLAGSRLKQWASSARFP